MKRLLTVKYIPLLLLLVAALLLAACKETLPAVSENSETSAYVSISKTPETSSTPTTPEEHYVNVPIITYKQDPESGEYVKTEESTYTAPEGGFLDLSIAAPEHYEIDREKTRLFLDDIKEGDSIVVYFKCKTVEVTFTDGENTATQTLRAGQTPTPPSFSRYGYSLTGFDKPVEPVYQDTLYTAVWELAQYTLTLYTAEGSSIESDGFEEQQGCFIKYFSVFDSFTLPSPQNERYHFLAWNTKADRSGKDYTEISKDTNSNIVLYAIYDVTLYEIAFQEENGISYPSYYLPYGTPVTAPEILPENQMAGFGLTWYEDKNGTKPYHFTTMPRNNIILYGKWEVDTGTGFLSWDLDNMENETIDSKEELAAFIDYVHFYNFTESVSIEVTYDTYQNVIADIGEIGMLGDFRANGALGYGAGEKTSYRHENAKCYVEIKVSKSYRESEATLSTEPTSEKAYTYLTEAIIPRGDAYTDFYIDRLQESIAVTTSNQLHYVAEHGYRPIPEQGSPAERIYLAAKKLLNAILPKDATDLEKAELIYLYLVQNVQYDDRAVQISETPGAVWSDYDAFFLEGVFDHKKAVCDGIAKAFSLLCNMEGIPCVEVVGNTHAWNRVKINNIWYVADPTHGNLHIANKDFSITDFSHFLMSDREKASLGYASESYPLIKANENYNYFANKTFTYNGYTFDYRIENSDELAILLAHLLTLKDDLDGCSIDLSYSSWFTSLSMAYQSALLTLNRSGIDFPYRATVIDPSFGTAYKIVFTR
ncbi:MAG: InlB B-repeat-containing protein [Clostridia bacterium]|nr:InlB B-repeat-containing protein [Clostridia bacterium]